MAIRKIVETLLDRLRFTGVSLVGILSRFGYLALFIICLFTIFYLYAFFGDGGSNWALICSGLPLGDKLGVLGRASLTMLDSFHSLYGISLFLLALLQAIVITQLVFTWRNREKNAAIDGASTGGIGAILGFVALGCPSCGVGLLSALLSAIAGASAAALATSIGVIFTALAFLLMIYTVIRLGYVDYIIIVNKKNKEEHAKSD